MASADRQPLVSVPHVLREYALLADGERGILVGPRGDFTWMCLPGWDGDGVFASLIGGGGMYATATLADRLGSRSECGRGQRSKS